MVVLWLIVVGLSRWDAEHVDGMDGVRANFGANFSREPSLDQCRNRMYVDSEHHGETHRESSSLCKLWHFGMLISVQ